MGGGGRDEEGARYDEEGAGVDSSESGARKARGRDEGRIVVESPAGERGAGVSKHITSTESGLLLL